jgi:hypothetical protein
MTAPRGSNLGGFVRRPFTAAPDPRFRNPPPSWAGRTLLCMAQPVADFPPLAGIYDPTTGQVEYPHVKSNQNVQTGAKRAKWGNARIPKAKSNPT